MAADLSLEFTELQCKVVALSPGRGGRFTLKSATNFELPRPDDAAARTAERAQALRDHLKAQKITARQADIVIPKNFVMVRAANLPSTVDDEIAGMAQFEAERHIPFNADRHITSYDVLSKNGAQGSDVLLAAVDGPIAQEYLDICVKAGLKVSSISVSSVSLFNAFAATQKAAMADKTVMVVNIGKSATDLVIATNGKVTFNRGSTTGVVRLLHDLHEATGDDVESDELAKMDALEPQVYFRGKQPVAPPPPPPPSTGLYDELGDAGAGEERTGTEDDAGFTVIKPSEPEPTPAPAVAASPGNRGAAVFSQWLDRLLQEVKRTFEFASREFASPMVDHIYLAGEGALVPHLADYFQANFNVETSIFDPTADGAAVIRPKAAPPEVGRIFAVTIGGAVTGLPGTLEIDLLPKSYTEEQSAKRQQVSYIVTGVLVFVALIAGYVYLSDTFARKRNLMDDLTTRNRADKARVEDLRTKKDRLRIIRENVQDDSGALDVLRILSDKEYIPEKVAMTVFDYKRGDYVKMEGDAKDLPAVNELINDMRNTGFFANTSLDNVTPNKPLRSRGGATVTGWKATFTFPKPEAPKKKSSSSRREETEDGFE